MTTIPQHVKECRAAMDKALENSRREFSSIRTGKATTSLLDTVRVDAYGSSVPVSQVASVAAPEPRLLTVTPWDKGLAHAIEKAIRDADLGLNPQSQGGVIRVPLPALNEERRRELVKVVHKLAEEGRIAVRHARTHARDIIKKLEKVSEDDKKHADKELQKLHDEHMAKIEEMVKSKEAEIMEV
ncbi:MAG TPA: ribosome recycling factor [Gemmatimonadaceae bacterium]|nr:ribosome recycling factor [Gemmatimonadaceae bacterium]